MPLSRFQTQIVLNLKNTLSHLTNGHNSIKKVFEKKLAPFHPFQCLTLINQNN